MTTKILIIFGSHPEAIKMAPVVKEFQRFPEKFDNRVCITAQHGVIGGINTKSIDKAFSFYNKYVKGTLHKTNVRTADINAYLVAHIEFKMASSKMIKLFLIFVGLLMNKQNILIL